MLAVSFEHVIEYSLYLIGLGSNGVDEQCLIRCVAVAMYGGFNGQQFIGFDSRNQPEAGGGQWFGGDGRDAALFYSGRHFEHPFRRPFLHCAVVLDIDHMRFAEVVVMCVEQLRGNGRVLGAAAFHQIGRWFVERGVGVLAQQILLHFDHFLST
mgnify:CR=1 FL=1